MDEISPDWKPPDPCSPDFFEAAMALADALIAVEGDSQKHFPESARRLMAALFLKEHTNG